MDYPYFRVTDWCRSFSIAENWFEWLRELGHPCAIVERENSEKTYSVWRYGVEEVERQRSPNQEGIVDRVLITANGWGKIDYLAIQPVLPVPDSFT